MTHTIISKIPRSPSRLGFHIRSWPRDRIFTSQMECSQTGYMNLRQPWTSPAETTGTRYYPRNCFSLNKSAYQWGSRHQQTEQPSTTQEGSSLTCYNEV